MTKNYIVYDFTIFEILFQFLYFTRNFTQMLHGSCIYKANKDKTDSKDKAIKLAKFQTQ